MHIQIANRLDYYTVNKSFPPISPYSHPIIQPLTAAVVPTIDIYDYDDFQQTPNSVWDNRAWWTILQRNVQATQAYTRCGSRRNSSPRTRGHTKPKGRKTFHSDALAVHGGGLIVCSGHTFEKSLSCRWKQTVCQSICRFLRRQCCPWTAKAFTEKGGEKKTWGLREEYGKASNTELMVCPLFFACSVITTNTGFQLSNTNEKGRKKIMQKNTTKTTHTHTIETDSGIHRVFRLRITWELQAKVTFQKLHKNSQDTGFKLPSNKTKCNILSFAHHTLHHSSFFIVRPVLPFLRRRNAFAWLQNNEIVGEAALSVIKGFLPCLYRVFIYNRGFKMTLGNNCLIGNALSRRHLKLCLGFLPQTQQPLKVLPSIDRYVTCKLWFKSFIKADASIHQQIKCRLHC